MRWLKILLLVNGLASISYAVSNILLPTTFFAPSDAAAGYGLDAVKLIGAGYLPLGIIQLGSWMITDRFSIRLVAVASLAYAVAFAALAAMAGSGSTDPFHQYGIGVAAAWALVAILYVWLVYRERSGAA